MLPEEYTTSPMQPTPPVLTPAKPKRKFGFAAGMLTGCLLPVAILFLFVILCAISMQSCTKALVDKQSEQLSSITESLDQLGQKVLIPGDEERQIVVIPIRGIIGRTGSDNIFAEDRIAASTRICKLLDKARKDESVAAVVIDMDTPGGEVVASDEIRASLDEVRAIGKPVVTCIHTMGCSGGYYIASGSNWIIANPVSFTGSIGVIMSTMDLTGLMEKIGVKPMVFKSGAMKDILSSTRPMTPEEDAHVNALIKETFERFCEVISEGRTEYFSNSYSVRSAEFADGRPISGKQAFKYNLIDQLGSFEDAIAMARDLSGCDNGRVIQYTRSNDFLDSIFAFVSKRHTLNIEGLSPKTLPEGRLYYLAP